MVALSAGAASGLKVVARECVRAVPHPCCQNWQGAKGLLGILLLMTEGRPNGMCSAVGGVDLALVGRTCCADPRGRAQRTDNEC